MRLVMNIAGVKHALFISSSLKFFSNLSLFIELCVHSSHALHDCDGSSPSGIIFSIPFLFVHGFLLSLYFLSVSVRTSAPRTASTRELCGDTWTASLLDFQQHIPRPPSHAEISARVLLWMNRALQTWCKQAYFTNHEVCVCLFSGLRELHFYTLVLFRISKGPFLSIH